MKTLFVRIFAWFWLATAVVVGAFFLCVTWTHESHGPQVPDDPLARSLDMIGQLTLAASQHEPPAQVRRQFDTADSSRFSRFYLFDDSTALSASVRPQLRQLVELSRTDSDLQIGHDSEKFSISKKVTAADGRSVIIGFDAPAMRSPFRSSLGPQVLAVRICSLLCVSGLVCYALARSLTAPLRRLTHAVNQLAKGNFTARVGPKLANRRDEFADLACTFDRMADKIQSLMNAKQRLLQDVSHELRSPLARLNVALELAREKAGPQSAGPLDRIARESDRLNTLISELLTLSSVGSTAEGQGEMVDVETLIEGVVEDAQFEAGGRGSTVAVLRTQPCQVHGHLGLMCRAVENVLRNAVQHTAPGTQTQVELVVEPTDAGHEAVIRIRDFGPGVPEHELQNIFQPFYTVPQGHLPKPPGHGLGLAIVQRIITQFDGRLLATNAPGGGLSVEIRLPCAATPLPERPPDRRTDRTANRNQNQA